MKEAVVKILAGITCLALCSLLFALPVMFLWNWLMPEIFGLVTINFGQSFGLCLLCGCIREVTAGSSSK